MSETLLHAETSELGQLEALRDQIDAILKGPRKPYLLGRAGERLKLPASAVEALRLVIGVLASGRSVTLIPRHRELTYQGRGCARIPGTSRR